MATRTQPPMMLTSHFFLLVLFAACVSIVFAALLRDGPREQVGFGVRMFAAFIVAGLLAGWLMYPFPF